MATTRRNTGTMAKVGRAIKKTTNKAVKKVEKALKPMGKAIMGTSKTSRPKAKKGPAKSRGK